MENLVIKGVECRLNENGVVELNLDHVARGLGFIKRDIKNGVYYERLHKQNIQKWLLSFGLLKSENEELPDFIPENIFYKLCLKAENQIALSFQNLVTDDILPSIRKNGAYLTPKKIEEVLLNPDTIIQLAQNWKEEKEKRLELETKFYQQQEIIEHKDKVIDELVPDAEYTNQVLLSKSTFTATQIAKEFGIGAVTLNRKLHKLGVQYKVGEQWVLYAKYQDKDYTETNTYTEIKNGVPKTFHSTVWTEKGRKFIHELLKNKATA